jgi:V/A-type H+-transporting ATPase subunit F
MKMFLLSDNIDTLTGLRLAGIEGKVMHTKEEVDLALDELVCNEEVAIILITALLADLVKKRVSEMLIKSTRPVLLVIPDRHGKTADNSANIMAATLGIK